MTSTFVHLNGKLVPEADALVPVTDRGFMYGDGLFETIRVHRGLTLRWFAHVERLQDGLERLGIHPPTPATELREASAALIEQNTLTDGLLRIQITRGSGLRGYSPKGANEPTVVITTHPAPPLTDPLPKWRLIRSSIRVQSDNPLNRIKSLNKLPYILAKAEAEAAGCDDALLLNERNEVAETTGANFFWIRNGAIFTPPLDSGALPGITRNFVTDLASFGEIDLTERSCALSDLQEAEGAFLTASSRVLIEVGEIDGQTIPSSPVFDRLHQGFLYFLNKGQGLS